MLHISEFARLKETKFVSSLIFISVTHACHPNHPFRVDILFLHCCFVSYRHFRLFPCVILVSNFSHPVSSFCLPLCHPCHPYVSSESLWRRPSLPFVTVISVFHPCHPFLVVLLACLSLGYSRHHSDKLCLQNNSFCVRVLPCLLSNA